MFTLVLTFIRQNAMFAAVAAFVAALCFQHVELGHLNAEVVSYRQENAVLTEANHTLSDLVDVQTSAIRHLQAESARKQQAAALALAQAKKTAQMNVVKAQAIEAYMGDGDECEAMRALLDTYFRR